ncbi:MAG: phosphoribosylglycinamide formyltransferase [Acidobacteria bacterium]|nr:phosphoribosylglycinamide formyltransferase [Acidobacteriota bacterium]
MAVLISGRGSNFEALYRATQDGQLPAEIVLVLSNVPSAAGIAHARSLGLPTAVVPSRGGGSRAAHEARVLNEIEQAGAEWICLAGYMRLLSAEFVGAYPNRILNIHPSLLPSFPGLDVQQAALDYGVRVSGCTVHLVDAGVDSGPIVAQRAVHVRNSDDAESLAARILREEHGLYAEALRRLLLEEWRIEGRRVVFGSTAQLDPSTGSAAEGLTAPPRAH